MARIVTIRQSLLSNQIPIIVLLSGGIMATTSVGAQRAVGTLLGALIDRATGQIEGELTGGSAARDDRTALLIERTGRI